MFPVHRASHQNACSATFSASYAARLASNPAAFAVAFPVLLAESIINVDTLLNVDIISALDEPQEPVEIEYVNRGEQVFVHT